ncbi:hypothetical protein ACFL02_03980 [Planctomycetota bacterium]
MEYLNDIIIIIFMGFAGFILTCFSYAFGIGIGITLRAFALWLLRTRPNKRSEQRVGKVGLFIGRCLAISIPVVIFYFGTEGDLSKLFKLAILIVSYILGGLAMLWWLKEKKK